jgi:adenylosuccinate synthase
VSFAVITCDLGLGDSAKGSIVDYLVREHHADGVVRFNGSGQAAHNVMTADGRHHTFSYFGSGTFVEGVWTHLSRFVLINPISVFFENERLRAVGVPDALSRLSADADCPITTPFHVAANRLRELGRGDRRHGSCGLGIGETMMDVLGGRAIYARDLHRPTLLRSKLREIQQRKRAELQWVIDTVAGADAHAQPLLSPQAIEDTFDVFRAFARTVALHEDFQYEGTLIFEAAQGVLLDEWAGFHPHTTWSTTTPKNAWELLAGGFNGEVQTVGIARTYMTRHGAGPLATEDRELAVHVPELHNRQGEWQGEWRVGHPDLVALRYAISVAGHLDYLAVSHMDYVTSDWKVCTGYRTATGEITELPLPRNEDLERQEALTRLVENANPVYEPAPDIIAAYETLGVPVGLLSYGPTAADKHMVNCALS